VDIPTPSLASHAIRPPNSRRSWARRMVRLAIVACAAAILAGFVFAPVASAATGDFIITGRGYAHGVGMSQWGMWQGAREGNTYQQILAFYYPGTTLTTVSDVNPARQTITVRITTGVDTFATVQLTAMVTPATLTDSTGATIQALAAGESVTLVYSGGKVLIQGADPVTGPSYSSVDFKPDSDTGRVKVTPSDIWSTGSRQYWGYVRVFPSSSTGELYIHNVVDIDHYAAGISEIAPEWAVPSSTSYYAPEAVKAQIVAARSYTAAHTGTVPYDDTRDINYVGYNVEAAYPYLTTAANETAGEVLTYAGKVIATHFSSSSGGYTTDSYWGDNSAAAFEPAQADPWSLSAPPTNPGYAWTVTISPEELATDLASHLNVGTITQVDVTSRDADDPGAHARYLTVTGSLGTKQIAARDFKAHVGLKSTLILSIVKDGSPNRYQQSNANLVYVGTWTPTSAAAAAGGSYRYSNTTGASCTVSFNGTSLAWLAKKGPSYGIAKLTLDGTGMGTVDLYSASVVFTKVWETGTLEEGTHTLKIERTGDKNALSTDKNISVDAFDIDGSIVPAPKPPPTTTYQQTDANLLYLGTWTAQSATAASGGSFRYINAKGSCTVRFTGTSLAWLAKRKSTYGIAKLTLDGASKGTVDLYSATETYGKVWETGALASGTHTLTIEWTGTKNASATGKNIAVDAFQIVGTISKAPSRYEQTESVITYAGSWATFSATGASGGSYKRAHTSGASVTIKFTGIYLGWIATKGTTLGKAKVSLDGGAAVNVNLAATAVAYQQLVWSTGILAAGSHTVKITWDTSNAAGKYISLDAVDLVGTLQ
jgi:SpoIID/LytB domain protein